MKRFSLITAMFFIIPAIGIADNVTWYNADLTTIYDTSTCAVGGDLILPTAPTKRGYDFVGWQMSGYTQLQYIRTTGTQYIDTGYVANSNTRVVMAFQLANEGQESSFLFGARAGVGERTYTVFWNSNGWQSDYNSTRTVITGSSYLNTDLIIDKNKGVATLYEMATGNQYATTNQGTPTFTTNSTLLIAAITQANAPRLQAKIKAIYYVKVYDNGTLIRDYIPVLDESGVTCFYDKQNKQYYYNAGTGDFVAGPAVQ